MKHFFFLFFIGLMAACSSENSSINQKAFTGNWKLVNLESNDAAKPVKPLTDCDTQILWQFTNEKAEPLGDGTEVMKVIANAPETCKWYGFDSKWTVKDGKLFISSTQVGGMGGSSNAGLFTIDEISEQKMTLSILHLKYSFEKQ